MVVNKKQIVENCQWLGYYNNSAVYKLDNQTVIKFINNMERYANSLKQQYGLVTDSIVYPREEAREDNRSVGYIMDFVDGILSCKHDYNDLMKLIDIASLVEKSIRITSECHLLLNDLHIYNALFKEVLKIIDTTTYKYYKDLNVVAIRRLNYKIYNDFMLELLDKANNFSRNDLYIVCMRSVKLFNYHELFFHGDIPISDLLIEMQKATKVLTLRDLKRCR